MCALRKSLSFTLSPKKQTSLAELNEATSLSRRQSFTAQSSADYLLPGAQNNDEAERKARQFSRLQTLQTKSGSSPTVATADRRKSLNTFAGLTHQQITKHYSTCIQLSAENKINTKNAFNLQLIDYMTEMLKRKDSDMNNFQVASCTLDASTKIYAYRVDSVHTDTLKMAGGLGRTKEKSVGETPFEEGPEGPGLAPKKRKGKHSAPIETNLKNINVAHFDLEFDIDPLYKRIASQFDEAQSGNHFLSSLQLLDDTCQLVLDSETILTHGFPQANSQTHSQIVSIPPIPDLGRVISKTFSPFTFLQWDLNSEDPFSEANKDGLLLHDLDANEDHAFDINAIPEPLDVDNVDQDRDDFDLAEDGDNDGTAITIGNACAQAGPRPPPPQLEILHLKDHLANIPLEYSYFDSSRMSAWAGPGHWKLKPLAKNVNKQLKSKESQKKDFMICYTTKKDKLDHHFDVLRRSTKLTNNTIKKWTFENTTLPVDLHYNPNNLCKFYFRPKIVIRRKQKSVMSDVDVEGYDYDNKNDNENFCPNVDDDDNYDEVGTAMCDDTSVFSQTFLPSSQPMSGYDEAKKDFFGDNLVEAPNMVAKINIGYAKIAKKMDMRKLKNNMWQLLSDLNSNKENKEDDGESAAVSIIKETMDQDYTVPFSSLYKELYTVLPIKMSENLSVHLAFSALLHLANERNLSLNPLGTLADFVVSQN